MIKVALVGYGQMGKIIHEYASQYGLEIVSTIDPYAQAEFKTLSLEAIKNATVCIDFSLPTSIQNNIDFYIENKIKCVIGTTGWYEEIEKVKAKVTQNSTAFIYASNFSIGMNVFFNIVQNAAKIMNNIDDYDVFGHELHHNKKADSPSGTANELASILLQNIDRKKELVTSAVQGQIKCESLHFSSTRAGRIPGTHTIGFDAEEDAIELTHRARSRVGFAKGAILATKWIANQQGFFAFRDVFAKVITK